MEHKSEDIFGLTYEQMDEYISSGRRAIEWAWLLIIMRPRAMTPADEAELEAMHALLADYGKLMAPFQKPKVPLMAANDEPGEQA
jgi:hypothetical protein